MDREQETVESIVFSIVAEQLGLDPGEIQRSSRFIDDLRADSLDGVDLMMEVENRF